MDLARITNMNTKWGIFLHMFARLSKQSQSQSQSRTLTRCDIMQWTYKLLDKYLFVLKSCHVYLFAILFCQA